MLGRMNKTPKTALLAQVATNTATKPESQRRQGKYRIDHQREAMAVYEDIMDRVDDFKDALSLIVRRPASDFEESHLLTGLRQIKEMIGQCHSLRRDLRQVHSLRGYRSLRD